VHDVLRTSLPENLLMIEESIAWLVEMGREVCFDAEHFFDGHASDPGYALRCVEAAIRGGARRVALCDTNGGTLPDAVEALTGRMTAAFGPVFGIHCHDDTGCAVANTLAAVRAGAVQVQGCINGYGERTGNANLCTLIPTLQLKMGRQVIDDEQLRQLTSTARDVAEIANLHPPISAPYVGGAAFTHKGGQHVDAIRKVAYAYQHIDPAEVGNRARSVVSAQSGGANILERAQALGVDLGDDRALARRVTARVKELEHQGYAFEGADGSFELLLERARGREPAFELVDYIALVQQHRDQAPSCEATVKVRIDDEVVHTVAVGNGPVNAIDAAMRKALSPSFPETANTQLYDYKVRVLDGTDGTAAVVRVLIESGDHQQRWSTVGCSSNIIEASWTALADAFEYCILRAQRGQHQAAATA
jgi:2-isopropylmalate synthase